MTKLINNFNGKYKFLSNFYLIEIEYEGITYPSIEHAYQAAKTINKEDRLKISNIKKCGDAKRYGQQLFLRNNWEQIKFKIMEELVRQKFTKDKLLKQLLLLTGDSILIEGNYWHDNIWGICNCSKCQNITGLNKLGNILMKIRLGV